MSTNPLPLSNSLPLAGERASVKGVNLKDEIRAALVGSSSQQPVDTDVLINGHHRRRVEAALMEMYQAHEVYCCKIIKGGTENVVWWTVGGVSAPTSFGRLCQPMVAVGRGVA